MIRALVKAVDDGFVELPYMSLSIWVVRVLRECVVCGRVCLDAQAGLCSLHFAEVSLGPRYSHCLLWISSESGNLCPMHENPQGESPRKNADTLE